MFVVKVAIKQGLYQFEVRKTALRYCHKILEVYRVGLYMACSEGFKPPTYRTATCCSIQLSYEHKSKVGILAKNP